MSNYFQNVGQHGLQFAALNTAEHFIKHTLTVLDISANRPQILSQVQHAAIGVAVGLGGQLSSTGPILSRLGTA